MKIYALQIAMILPWKLFFHCFYNYQGNQILKETNKIKCKKKEKGIKPKTTNQPNLPPTKKKSNKKDAWASQLRYRISLRIK